MMETTKTEVDITRFIDEESSNLHKIKAWLKEHVGEPKDDSKVCREGDGWKFGFQSNVDEESGQYKYKVFILFDRADEAIMFKLSWS